MLPPESQPSCLGRTEGRGLTVMSWMQWSAEVPWMHRTEGWMPACWKALLMSLHFCCSASEMVHHRTSIPPSTGVGWGTVRPGPCSPSPLWDPSAQIASPHHSPALPLCGTRAQRGVAAWEGAGLTCKVMCGPCIPCTCLGADIWPFALASEGLPL